MYRWLLAAALTVSAASSADIPTDPTAERIMTMPPALQAQFAAHVLPGKPSRRVRLDRIVEFVFDTRGLGMRYEDGATHTVAQAWETRMANCLGFTLLFLALAREAGLEAWPQVYEDTLSWHRTDGVLYRNSHVNAVVSLGARDFTLDMARGAVITRGRPVRLTLQGLEARFLNNRAVEAMQEGDLVSARRLMAISLDLDANQSSHWSNAGVLELHGGDEAAARRDYDQALAIDPENANALFNLVNLARRAGDTELEAEYRQRLARVQRKDPFHQFLQAIDHELAGDFKQAIAHYRRAIRLHGGDHRFHAALAGALERSGDRAAARKALKLAIARSDGTARDGYRKRLGDLRLQ